MNRDTKHGLAIGVAVAALVSAMPTKAQPMLEDANIVYQPESKEAVTTDTVVGASAATWGLASLASWALPTAVAHSSGGAILYSGAGYVAGTMGAAATTVAMLPFIAAGAAVVGTGAVVYKYYGDDIEAAYADFKGEE